MTYYSGKKSYVGLCRQDTAGTVEATPAIFIATGEWPSLKTETLNQYPKEFRGAMGSIQNVYRKASIKSTGSLSAPAYTDLLSYGMYGVLGKVTSSGDADGYTHAINANAATLPIWTVFMGLDTVNQMRYRDLTMKSISLGFEPNEYLTTSIDFEGGPVDIADGVETPSYTSLRPLQYADVAVNLGTSTADCQIESMNLTISRQPQFMKTMCTGNTAWNDNVVLPTDVICEGTFNMLFVDYEDYELWLGANNATTPLTDTYARGSDDQTLTITITSTGTHIGSGSTHDSCTITIPEMIYDDANITPDYDGFVKVQFNWKAVHNATAESNVPGTGTVKVDIVSEVADPDA